MDEIELDGKGDTEQDRNGLQVLDRAECLQLMSTATLGRIGINLAALPVVLPVNFRLVGDQIVFRTSSGSKLDAAVDNAVVAFEVDDIEAFSHAGWSVVVTGIAREVTDPAERERLQAAHIPRWAPSDDDRLVTVSTALVSGRRLLPAVRPA